MERLGVGGSLTHLAENADDLATVEAVFAACDLDGDG